MLFVVEMSAYNTTILILYFEKPYCASYGFLLKRQTTQTLVAP